MVTSNESIAVLNEEGPVSECRHHWVIEPANGPVSRGECVNCHSVREFYNSIHEPERED